MAEVVIFLDTNILLHFIDLDQIDWLDMFKVKQIRILINFVNIRELDKKKNQGSTRTKKRARKVSAKMRALIDKENYETVIREGVVLKVYLDDIDIDLESYGLVEGEQDDELIGLILAYQKHFSNKDVRLLTDDTICFYKADKCGIDVSVPDETLRLPDKQDATERRIEVLEKEVKKYVAKLPNLRLYFGDGEEEKTIRLLPPVSVNPQSIQFRVDRKRRELAKFPEEVAIDGVQSSTVEMFLDPLGLGRDSRSKYNIELERYFTNYGNYLYQIYDWENFTRRTINLDLMVSNTGNQPANNVKVSIYFPDDLKVWDNSELPDRPKKPYPPKYQDPGTLLSRKLNFPIQFSSDFYRNRALIDALGNINVKDNVSGFDIKETNSYEVSFGIVKVMHFNIESTTEPLIITYDSYEEAFSVNIGYRIIADEIPEPVFGKLVVNIDK